MTQLTLQQMFELAGQHRRGGRAAEAEALYRQILAQQPQHADAMHLRGITLFQLGRAGEALELIRQAVALNPGRSDYLHNLGLVSAALGKADEAIAAYRQALAARPDFPEACSSLANALRAKGDLDGAAEMFRRAATLRPQDPEAHNGLGCALMDQGRSEEAAAAFRAALALKPDHAQALYNLGNAMVALGRLDEAVESFRAATILRPDDADAHNNLGMALKEIAQLDQSLASFERGLAVSPNQQSIDSNRVYTLYFHPRYDAGAILKENLLWNQRHAADLAGQIQPHRNDRSPQRRLRIGYVSHDFFNHCQSFFTFPLLGHHDHGLFEVFCYASVARPDEFTQHLRGFAGVWRDCLGKSDADVAQMIRDDQIDVLVDLTMHMAHGRLLVSARKPAPVQVAWLAYPGTTGLSAIDYRLTDPYLDPPGSDAYYSEKSIRLPETFWCYDPLTRQPTVNELPALQNRCVTFGCLNNFCKINPPLLQLWARVLSAVPDSKLLLLVPQGSSRRWVLQTLGIDPLRVDFVPYQTRRMYLQTYHRIDLGLDTFPYNGHTSSLDSLWMGVPVVSLCGQTAVSRAGLSQTSNLGVAQDWVAQTPDEFVQLAAKWAHDLPRLAQLRSTLRPRMQQSPLMDAARFTRNMEAAYRQLWKQWCDGPR